jgi:hypothetical protein
VTVHPCQLVSISWRNRAGSSSGPLALEGFSFFSNLAIPTSPKVILSMLGNLCGGVGMFERSSVKTDENWAIGDNFESCYSVIVLPTCSFVYIFVKNKMI